jgi:drug/metabolite transporter (DMT)-like permease
MSVAGVAPDRRRFAIAFAALVLGAVGMGASPVFVRLADVGPFASAFWRAFLALPFLLAWAWFEDGGRHGSQPLRDPVAILAGLCFTGDLCFWHLAIFGTTVANATFMATTSPIWVALGAWLMVSERIGAWTLAGLAFCLLGGAALIGDSYRFMPQRLLGDCYGLITAGFFGAYALAIGVGRRRYGAARLAFIATAITAACLLAIATLCEPRLMPRSGSGWAALVALAMVSQVGGQGLFAVALGTLPAMFSSLVIFLEAIAAASFGWLVFGEALGRVQLLGGVLILLGIWVARPRGDAPMPTPAGP